MQSNPLATGPLNGPSKALVSIQLIPANPPFSAVVTWLVTSTVNTVPPVPLAKLMGVALLPLVYPMTSEFLARRKS